MKSSYEILYFSGVQWKIEPKSAGNGGFTGKMGISLKVKTYRKLVQNGVFFLKNGVEIKGQLMYKKPVNPFTAGTRKSGDW